MKKKTQTVAQIKKRLQVKVNAYIRQRDSKNGFFKCISCGKTLPTEKMNAGHYVPVSRCQALRYDENNINGECAGCNCFDEFHLIGYRRNLITKRGIDAVLFLERTAEEKKVHKFTKADLELIETHYNQLLALQ